MPTYTLIHYRPNYEKCRSGYREEWSDSEIEIVYCGDDHKAAVAGIARKMLYNANNKFLAYADWETTILIDGYLQGCRPAYEQGCSPGCSEISFLEDAKYIAIEKRATAMFTEMKAEHDEKERIKQETEANKEALAAEYAASDKEMKERAQYKLLHAKYGSQS